MGTSMSCSAICSRARGRRGETTALRPNGLPGEGGWICAETAEAPEAISQGRMLEEAKANVAEAPGERAQVTVTPVAVPDAERPRRLPLRPRRCVRLTALWTSARRWKVAGALARAAFAGRTRAEESDPRSLTPRQMGRKSGPARNVVDASWTPTTRLETPG